MKIYTRTGDDGSTGLFGGDRVKKSHSRIRACGAVDEANAALGLAVMLHKGSEGDVELAPVLKRLQSELFALGSDLATPLDSRAKVPRTTSSQVANLEGLIDAFSAPLPPLRNFILPGGTPAACQLHIARAVCRRAERVVVAAQADVALTPAAVIFLNRLSDLLFVLARWVNYRSGVNDELWKPTVD